jgi:hypothetical protein
MTTMTGELFHRRALVGKAGEAFVAAELLKREIDVAYPAYDGGVDLLAYREHLFEKVVPIQVKSGSDHSFAFMKSWFRIQSIVLIHVWHVRTVPEYYIFGSVKEVEDVLAEHALSASWSKRGKYSITNPNEEHFARMQPYRNRWATIIDRLS